MVLSAQGDEEKLLTFERKILRKIHGPVRLQNGEHESRKYEDLEMLFNKLNIRLFLKAQRLEWGVGWSRLTSFRKSYKKRLNQKPKKKRPRRRPRQRWLDKVKRRIF